MSYTESAFIMGALTGAGIMWVVNHTLAFFREIKNENVLIENFKEILENQSEILDLLSPVDEIDDLFNEEIEKRGDNGETVEILNIGLEKAKHKYFTKSSGGYMTNTELEHKNFLSEKEEQAILDVFSHLKGLRYSDARRVVEQKGYEIWPYCINGTKYQRQLYGSNVIGVSVIDDKVVGKVSPIDFSSSTAHIDKLVNVGGREIEFKRGTDPESVF